MFTLILHKGTFLSHDDIRKKVHDVTPSSEKDKELRFYQSKTLFILDVVFVITQNIFSNVFSFTCTITNDATFSHAYIVDELETLLRLSLMKDVTDILVYESVKVYEIVLWTSTIVFEMSGVGFNM